MAAITSAPPWNPEDDFLLKNAVEAGASLEALAKGAVRFSRKFTVHELRERWRSLLYDADVSAEASARMIEFELSNPNLLSKSSRCGTSSISVGGSSFPAKRKIESIRRKYYERRKRLCSLNTFDLSFIDEPNVNGEHVNVGNELLDGGYMVGDHVENYFEFAERGLSVVDHGDLSIRKEDERGSEQNNGEHNLVGSGGNDLFDFRNCSNAEEVGTSHALPDMPLWKTIEDVSAPEMPIDVGLEAKCGNVEETLVQGDNETGNKISSPGFNVPSDSIFDNALPEDIHRDLTMSVEEFADISNSLLNFPNESEPLVMDVDGENMNDKSCYENVKSLLLSSPKDGRGDDVANVCQPENLDLKTLQTVSEDVCSAEKNDNADLRHSGDGIEHSIGCSETNITSTKSVLNPHSPEVHYEMMECTLNSEDPEIPCNDDVIQPRCTESSAQVPSFTNQENSRLETRNLKREEKPAESFMASQMVGHRTVTKSTQNFPLVGCGVKLEPSDGNRLASVAKPASNVLAAPSKSVHVTPKLAANQVQKQEGINAPVTIRGKQAFLSRDPGSTDTALWEPEAKPSALNQDESEEESDGGDNEIPCFSDIENMILEMDLSPDDQDSYVSKEVLRYQSEDAKRKIMRLEQSARSSMQRAIASKGAFAVLYGRQLKQYIKRPEVILGRATEDNEVDIDLGKEGRANKISRRQAVIKMEGDGSFFLNNISKSSIFLNGKEVAAGHRLCLSSNSLIEIRGMSFVFEMNHKSVRRYLAEIGKNSKEKYSKFEWLP